MGGCYSGGGTARVERPRLEAPPKEERAAARRGADSSRPVSAPVPGTSARPGAEPCRSVPCSVLGQRSDRLVGRQSRSVGEGVVDASDVELVSGAGASASRGPAASAETTTMSSALDSATKADSQKNASAETTSNQRLTHWAASQVSDAPEGRSLRLGPSDPAAFIPVP